MIGQANISDAEIQQHIELYATTEAQEIRDFSELRQKIGERLNEPSMFGDTLPWGDTHDKFRFRPKEVTVWAGESGCGKSLVLGQVITHVSQNAPCGIISLEMPPEDTGARIAMQCTAAKDPSPSDEYLDRLSAALSGRIFIYDRLTVMPSNMVLGVVRCLFDRFKCKHVVVDSLSMCGIGVEDRGGEKNMILQLGALAKQFAGHIHLVAHMRKAPAGHTGGRSKYDVKGDSSITDLVQNCILVSRDWKRYKIQQEIAKNGHSDDEEYLGQSRDQYLQVVKNRSAPYHGTMGFYLHPCLQFTRQEGRAIPFRF